MSVIQEPSLTQRRQQVFALMQRGDLPAALDLQQRLCDEMPGEEQHWLHLGTLFGMLGRFGEARTAFARAERLNPNSYQALEGLGQACFRSGNQAEAALYLRRAIELQPRSVAALFTMGQVQLDLGHFRSAQEHLERAIAVDPGFMQAYLMLGHVFVWAGMVDEAIATYEKIPASDPAGAAATAGIARAMVRSKKLDEAYDRLRPLLDAGSDNIDVLNAFAEICAKTGRADEAVARLSRVLETVPTPDARRRLNFSLGTLYAKTGDYERSFRHYEAANRSMPEYRSKEGHLALMDAVREFFEATEPGALPRVPGAGKGLIFVLGMPRSGTTLVEQILSSHPRVFGAGEIPFMGNISRQLPGLLKTDEPYPRCLPSADEAMLRWLGEEYVKEARRGADGETFVVDKMPHNFLHVGLIRMMFPEARIINCIRDARDTCLSCFFQDFWPRHAFTTDLGMLGRYYTRYRELMEMWKGKGVPILEFHYEELVADQERLTRALLEYCGLDWNDACMRFFENRRGVSTASYDQVNKPIYKGSIGRWQRYEPWIAPLLDALQGE